MMEELLGNTPMARRLTELGVTPEVLLSSDTELPRVLELERSNALLRSACKKLQAQVEARDEIILAKSGLSALDGIIKAHGAAKEKLNLNRGDNKC